MLSYDRRQRGTPIEMSPEAALQHIFHLQSALERWPRRSLDEPVLVTSMVARDGRTVTGWSTLARECFVVSHTTHHHATIGVLLMLQGLAVPDGSRPLSVDPVTPLTHRVHRHRHSSRRRLPRSLQSVTSGSTAPMRSRRRGSGWGGVGASIRRIRLAAERGLA